MTALGDEGLRVRAAATRSTAKLRVEAGECAQCTLCALCTGAVAPSSAQAATACAWSCALCCTLAPSHRGRPGRRLVRSAQLYAKLFGHKKRFVCKTSRKSALVYVFSCGVLHSRSFCSLPNVYLILVNQRSSHTNRLSNPSSTAPRRAAGIAL